MSRPALGSLAWCRTTGGQLSASDRLHLATRGVLLQLRRIPKSLRRRFGLPSTSASLDLEPLAAPDSAIARAAEEAVADLSPEPLVHHVYRSYAWAQVLAARARQKPDREILYLACLLHDLGLVDIEPATDSCCFAYDGAEAALTLLTQAGCDPQRAHRVADAIALHLHVQVDLQEGIEAHLLNAGSALDVVGLGLLRIPKTLRQQVLTKHPRDGWNEQILPKLGDQVRRHPNNRIAFLVRRFGFSQRAANTHF